MNNNQQIGKMGEEIATKYLCKSHYTILDRNFSCKQGEIDIIAHNSNELIFVEVKTRRNLHYGRPAEAVTYIKKKHIEKVAKYYIHKKHLENEYVRFDVIEVYINKDKCRINHIKQVI